MTAELLTAGAALAALAATGAGLAHQCRAAFRRINRINRGKGRGVLSRSGTFGDGPVPVRIGLMGDSLAAGLGADAAATAPTALIGTLVADRLGSGVTVSARNVAYAGSSATDLPRQLERLTGKTGAPDAVVVITGSNDTPFPQRAGRSVRHLTETVGALRAGGAAVVVCTVPALYRVPGMPVPLRWALGLSADLLERRQYRAALAAGAEVVRLRETATPLFLADPALYSEDAFHPGPEGYRASCAPIGEAVATALLRAGAGTPPAAADAAAAVVAAEAVVESAEAVVQAAEPAVQAVRNAQPATSG